jgi:uncharacterized protein YndB with AHSA1/START domain
MDRPEIDERWLDGAPDRVEESIEVDSPAGDVWEALTDAAILSEWFDADVEIDVRVAGSGRVLERDGTVREVLVTDVDPGRRLAWHWWDDRGRLSSVEFTVEPVVDATRIRVVEVLVPDTEPRARASASVNWTAALQRAAAPFTLVTVR